jgi:hypothetical protein
MIEKLQGGPDTIFMRPFLNHDFPAAIRGAAAKPPQPKKGPFLSWSRPFTIDGMIPKILVGY